MEALQGLGQMLRPWPSAMRVFTAAVCVIDKMRAQAGRAQPGSGHRLWMPTMSSRWLLEHEIAASKHQDNC